MLIAFQAQISRKFIPTTALSLLPNSFGVALLFRLLDGNKIGGRGADRISGTNFKKISCVKCTSNSISNIANLNG